ncbi:hypothetical protein [Chitinophaga pinensis]|uniref:Uncharacterized protein n=1 Tax=Chitinophaga pinensis (strain ATCC 43595 / DSM 2588 / LMG 13176 / NBRC 15968 / NCIMB 11800 / UQM 2034) TaxID=485918 RepID=A0A979GWK4_CHIPD|nr:hypothetical protein [Chitinophaga pinensis]ACU61821.1 hypothetical protein Cpin_4374 [Chitinophaga pinensis DSM 2588]
MAKTKNPLFTGYKLSSGASDKQFVVKKRRGTAIISKYPDMSNVVPSDLQKTERSRFAAAIKYAKSIVHDPVLKANYKRHPGSTVYHSAIKDYLGC